ncbi:MAG: glycosyltransferase family 2 protein, partial [Phycisphaerales bacterium]
VTGECSDSAGRGVTSITVANGPAERGAEERGGSPGGDGVGGLVPATLSVFMACRNNVGTINATLASLKGLATEVVAVDSGSTDGTLEALAASGARVVHSPWLGYIKTKQLALESCTLPWRMCVDSDEVVLPDLREAIIDVLRADDAGVDACTMNRATWYRGRALRFAWQPEYRVRLVRAGRARWGGMDPHDALSADAPGRTVRIKGTLRHDSFASFEEHLSRQLHYSRVWAENMRARGERGSYTRLLTSPAGAFLKQMIIKQAWRDGVGGWLAAGSTAAGTLMKHMILLERASAETGAA